MAITAQQVLDKARDMMGDVGGSGGFRLEDPIGLQYVIDAYQDIWERRHLSLQNDGTDAVIGVLAALTDVLTNVEDRYLQALAHYVAHRAYQHDTDDQQSATLSVQNLGLYRQLS
jgi:hypothetical protein